MFNSRIFLKSMLIVGITIALYTASFYSLILPKIGHNIQEIEEKNAKDTLLKITLLIKNFHTDVETYRKRAIEDHKHTLRSIVDTAHSILLEKYKESSLEALDAQLTKEGKDLERTLQKNYAQYHTKISSDALKILLLETIASKGNTFFIYDTDKKSFFKTPPNAYRNTLIPQHVGIKHERLGKETIVSYGFFFEPLGWMVGWVVSHDAYVKERQEEAKSLISKLRYDKNNYFYISTFDNIIITHPYLKNFDMTNIKDINGKPIVGPIRELISEKGEGFYNYFWKRNSNDPAPYEKMTHFKALREWEMVVGTGVYIDDVQDEVTRRKNELMEQLTRIVHATKIGQSGYLFLFDANDTLLIHPNPPTQLSSRDTALLESLKQAAHASKTVRYTWNKPSDSTNFTYEKIAWVEYIPEFDWYLGSSVYADEFKEPYNEVKTTVSLTALVLMLLSAISSYVFFRNILSPLIASSKHAAMGEVLSIIAHQWRQPLNELGLVLQKFEFAYHKNLLTQEFLHKETASAKNLLNKMSSTIDIFRNFLSLRKEQGECDVLDTIHNAITLFEETCKHDAIKIVLEGIETKSIVSFQGEFEHVILNILNNARDILNQTQPHPKRIYITTHRQKKELIIRVYDNAGGIDASIIDRVFNPHFSTKPDGSGIGLYIAKKIIEEHLNGALKVQNAHFSLNESTYFGACFEISI